MRNSAIAPPSVCPIGLTIKEQGIASMDHRLDTLAWGQSVKLKIKMNIKQNKLIELIKSQP